ncbi:membrane-associated protein [Spirosoma oryzae]|uniref:Membrane-associated protein n=1 Tax=Spirosoma oryzae TaxID=1469603 RepID=A0A2T0SUL5_9BACT|nr:DedA family protein [Spirosoma oryzae]PRY37105.1 membrane-associated protein [Spirosoma oryzae]
MDLIKSLLDFLLHLDRYLDLWANEYGVLLYAILFLIVFTETGLIVMPLLPGDSLLFAAGALAARDTNELSVGVIIPLLIVAALLGDNVNYFVGRTLGNQIKMRERILFFKREYILETEKFYAKYGGRTVIMARFIPIVRTIAPFVAGAGSMIYSTFIRNCILGAILWVTSITLVGYFLGNLEVVQKNFEFVVFGIVGISLLPILFEVVKKRFA